MIKCNNFNFTAASTISANHVLTIDSTNSDAQSLKVKVAGSTDRPIGVALSDHAAGETVNFQKLDVGQVFVCVAGGAISKGAQCGFSSGKVVTGGSMPIYAIDAASASGDLIRCIYC